ncbi:hypothetical protein N7478_003605 [Penicillium angulare]|uniref:uncharacterized protein n=1 Tax=Penicillium angulare TaxID=116970 RepID=UPI002542408B|nr:uncharacterized protein N7478_003605 [Penicillium angulare]KAJ5287919.1 hypothetical protein N7478_003605 [Penicillium angulare]
MVLMPSCFVERACMHSTSPSPCQRAKKVGAGSHAAGQGVCAVAYVEGNVGYGRKYHMRRQADMARVQATKANPGARIVLTGTSNVNTARNCLFSPKMHILSKHRKWKLQQVNMVQSRVEVDMSINGFLCAIDATMDFALDASKAWSSRQPFNNELLQALSPHTAGRDFKSAIYWLLVRLATNSNLQIALPTSPPYIADADMGLDPYSFVFCYASRPLWLCGRAVEFAHNEDSIPRYPPLQTWMQLVEDLENWYDERPQGFQAMLELELEDQEGTGQNFPIVLFANGAGVFSNQLYHTAMLILLHNRPRTARVANFSSTTMSPLWHAQRICSIVLNNERQECWDPCLLASFLSAARRMTHETQQQEILHAFDRIKNVTGWDLGDLLDGLKEDWGFLET